MNKAITYTSEHFEVSASFSPYGVLHVENIRVLKYGEDVYKAKEEMDEILRALQDDQYERNSKALFEGGESDGV